MLDKEDEDRAAGVLVWPDELSHLVGETRANSWVPECNQHVRAIGELIRLVEGCLWSDRTGGERLELHSDTFHSEAWEIDEMKDDE